jgi:hypothetical protein
VRIDAEDGLAEAIESIGAYRDAGVDLIILNLPLHAPPESLNPIADALTA